MISQEGPFRDDSPSVDELWSAYNDGPEPTESPAEILDRHMYEVLRVWDPSVRLDRHLRLRVAGEAVHMGRLDIGITEELFHAFSQEVAGAAEVNAIKGAVSFELAGVSTGSAVMHLVPTMQEDHGADQQMALTFDPLDGVLKTITDLHETAENEGDLRQFARHISLVRGLRLLAIALDNHNLELEVGWRSATGKHRVSHLSSRARRHIRQLWEVESVIREFRVTGRVVKLDLSGRFDVKASLARNSKRYEIQVTGDEGIVNLGLQLGEYISVLIREEKRVNHLGIEQPPSYRLIRAEKDQPLIDG